ncbi:hypothetical protein J6590_067168 [Homalodisca vitripennis]|nr:hypothetical protein J6590_067168 [Homalodisca vitripennis]
MNLSESLPGTLVPINGLIWNVGRGAEHSRCWMRKRIPAILFYPFQKQSVDVEVPKIPDYEEEDPNNLVPNQSQKVGRGV